MLNNIFKIEEINYAYANVAISENNNLYFMTSNYPEGNIRKFYLLNNQGHSLNNENPFLSLQIADSNTVGRFESQIFIMKLYESNDDKEYVVSISKAAQNIEIYDFNQNQNHFYIKQLVNAFGIPYQNYQLMGAHFKLKLAEKENKNSYLISFTACKGDNCNEEQTHVYLFKTNFTSLHIDTEIESLKYISTKFPSSPSKVVSCYETDNNFLICFYQNTLFEYAMIVLDYSFTIKTQLKIADGYSLGKQENEDDWFFKCIHFFDEIGVFGYFINSVFQFEFKEYINSNNEIKNRFTNPQIRLDNYIFNKEKPTMCDMIKINDKKFYFVGVSAEKDIFIVLSIFNYDGEKLAKRIYSISSKNYFNYMLSGQINLSLYNNLLVMAATYFLPDWSSSSSLLIFSYPQTDSVSLNLISYIYSHNIKIYNLEIQLEGKYSRIDNNLFGLEYSGIKINGNCKDLENIYLADLNDNQILSNYYLSKNDSIKLIIPRKENYNSFTCKFDYAIVVSEPEFEKFNLYPVEYLDTGNEHKEEEFFENQKTNYTGKYNIYELILEYDLTETNCGKNCELCKSNQEDDVPQCVSCKYSYHFEENNIKVCEDSMEEDKITEIGTLTEVDSSNIIDSTLEKDLSTEIDTFTKTDIFTEIDTSIESDSLTGTINSIEVNIPTETSILTEKDNPIETITATETNTLTEADTLKKTDISIENDTLSETMAIIGMSNDGKNDIMETNFPSQTEIHIETNKLCKLDEILDNKCSKEIENYQIEDVYSYILTNLINNNYSLIQTNNIIFEVSTSKDQIISKNKNISNIDLGKCEQRLKVLNNISESKDLIIFKIDTKCLNQSTTYVQYEIYNPDNYKKLEMSLCKDLKIDIYTPIYLDDETQSLFSSLKKSGYDLFNSNDSFYNDFCTPYTSVNGTDILLKDRKKDIFQKNGDMDLCQKNCELEYYNENTQKAKCNCAAQENITNLDLFHTMMNQKNRLEESFYNTLNNANFQVLKCYKLAIDLKSIFENIGRIIMTFIVFFALIALIYYFSCENKKLKNFLTQILNEKIYN